MRGSVALLAFALFVSGCTTPGNSDAQGGSGQLTRTLTADLGEDAMAEFSQASDPEDFMAALSDVSYTYTHKGGALDVDGVDVKYQDESGRSKTAPLGDFTSKSTLQDGDRVTIDGLFLGSALELRLGV